MYGSLKGCGWAMFGQVPRAKRHLLRARRARATTGQGPQVRRHLVRAWKGRAVVLQGQDCRLAVGPQGPQRVRQLVECQAVHRPAGRLQALAMTLERLPTELGLVAVLQAVQPALLDCF